MSRLIFRGEALDIRTLPKTATPARVLIVTPRKSGNAVERNLFRRRVRALFYECGFHEGVNDWLIFAKKASLTSYAELRKLLINIAAELSARASGT